MSNPTERGTDDPTGYAPKVGMSYEIVREALENPSCVEHSTGDLTWRDHEAGEAIAALDRIEAENEKLDGLVQSSYPSDVVDNLRVENARLRNELADWDERTDGFTREARAEEPDDIDANKPPMKLGNKVSEEPAK